MMLPYTDIHWKDCIEILFFSGIAYYIALWLSKDKQKNVLVYFYAYCTVTLCAYWLGFSGIASLTCASLPVMCMLFITMHQETLQKNMIALHALQVPSMPVINEQWQEILLRSCLFLLYKKYPIVCVIEQKDSIDQFVTSSYILDTPLQAGLLEILIHEQPQEHHCVWISQTGKIKSITSYWKQSHTPQESLALWKQEALLLSSKTDAIIIAGHVHNHTFSCIAQGKIVEHISADQALRIVQKYTRSSIKKGNYYAPSSEKPSEHQPHA